MIGKSALWSMVLGMAVLGCAGTTSSTGDPFGTEASTVTIEVDNHNFQDATLHAIAPGLRRRLGTVTGKGQGRFTLRWDFSQPLQIEIDLLAAGRCVTRALQVDPGETVQLIVESNLDSDPDCR